MAEILSRAEKAALTQELADQLIDALKAQGTPVDLARGRAAMADFNTDIQKAIARLVSRLGAAAGACQAMDGRWGRFTWCNGTGTSERDGRRVCRRHARAQLIRWGDA